MTSLPLKVAADNAEHLVSTYTRNPWEWQKRVRELAKIEKNKAPDMGTKVHSMIENYFKWEMCDRGHDFYVDDEYIVVMKALEGFIKENKILPKSEEYLEKVVVNHDTKDAGTLDFKGKAWGCNRVYIDWKTQNIKKGKPNFYQDWGLQLAQYCASDNNNTIPDDARCFNVVISTAGFGVKDYKPDIHVKEWKNLSALKETFDKVSGLFFTMLEGIE